MKPTKNKVPRHVGIILDGNRRFAKQLMIKPWKGHEWGAKRFDEIFEVARKAGVKELTLYVFSLENLGRPKKELDYLMNLFRKEFERFKNDSRVQKYGVRVNFIGRLDVFPEDVQKKARELMELTKDNDSYFINFAMGYGGREEVIHATKLIAEKISKGEMAVDDINEEVFSKNVYISSQPDLIIRTGGEKRLSNFLMWQSGYAELMFVDTKWPEFKEEDFLKCLEEYAKRHRRFGK
jgi:tritrans,polycis-undecaprenyl-diphosphate synthase [geranylgeranyl-diphosphate specific]